MRAELSRQRDELDRIARSVEQLTAEAASPDHLVAIEINARGLLTGLRIEPAVFRRYRADQLAAEVVRLVGLADRKIAAIRNQTIAATVQSLSDYSGDQGE
ncbi:YbaB/EbfC family nucleoid-associated protein [Gordonia sp. CPCC 205333]|uniref:YbaB/EbfC family nucleoid-associated protein n=1 Tax=Gordonia sp. CPCC 205333 TaxID=3140790 RepID=UPI003AF33218